MSDYNYEREEGDLAGHFVPVETPPAKAKPLSAKLCQLFTGFGVLFALAYASGLFPNFLVTLYQDEPFLVAGITAVCSIFISAVIADFLPGEYDELGYIPFMLTLNFWAGILWSNILDDGLIANRIVEVPYSGAALTVVASFAAAFCLAFHQNRVVVVKWANAFGYGGIINIVTVSLIVILVNLVNTTNDDVQNRYKETERKYLACKLTAIDADHLKACEPLKTLSK